MVLEILCVEPIYPQYSGVLETCLALRYWFFGCLAAKVLIKTGAVVDCQNNESVDRLYFYTMRDALADTGTLACEQCDECFTLFA